MANTPQASRWACIFSIRWLFRPVDLRELSDDAPPKAAFLWTWTFPDLETRLDPRECARRWSLMCNDKNMRGKRFVHSFEQAPGSGFWHYHGVTGDYWDVSDMREIAEHHGFGRINVVRVPFAKAEYVAKYLSKSLPDLPAGMRRWACHGFTGVRASDIILNKTVDEVTQTCIHGPGLWDGWEWRLADRSTITVLHREDADPFFPKLKKMELKPTAQKELIAQIAAGKVLAVGEYRGCSVRKQSVTDKKTFRTEERLIVEHTVEFGTSSTKISEWLPVGASADVKPPANKGENVVVVVLEISRQYGMKVESIKPLASLL